MILTSIPIDWYYRNEVYGFFGIMATDSYCQVLWSLIKIILKSLLPQRNCRV
jgi:hypothetical protein